MFTKQNQKIRKAKLGCSDTTLLSFGCSHVCAPSSDNMLRKAIVLGLASRRRMLTQRLAGNNQNLLKKQFRGVNESRWLSPPMDISNRGGLTSVFSDLVGENRISVGGLIDGNGMRCWRGELDHRNSDSQHNSGSCYFMSALYESVVSHRSSWHISCCNQVDHITALLLL
ncbi:hypothetical protein EVAR_36327_1 [Eumeta japonica]|uniref:Uncharacterized protein n=1 Tax=Eumeta variegata TaxID=151549 RepID=A0A4C1VKH9_EUMVA|nr:hypothetical protein EVAR_36327_1 [Eumeta japonica]